MLRNDSLLYIIYIASLGAGVYEARCNKHNIVVKKKEIYSF